ncbi:hypothetical protein GJ496_004160 [Pomphorhynchus laevis]|nr:hypothetical protein GJ496_004160 [Pomphorhynchus laevis]
MYLHCSKCHRKFRYIYIGTFVKNMSTSEIASKLKAKMKEYASLEKLYALENTCRMHFAMNRLQQCLESLYHLKVLNREFDLPIYTSFDVNIALVKLEQSGRNDVVAALRNWENILNCSIDKFTDYSSITLTSPAALYNYVVCLYNCNDEPNIEGAIEYLLSKINTLPDKLLANCIYLRAILYYRKFQHQCALIMIQALEDMLLFKRVQIRYRAAILCDGGSLEPYHGASIFNEPSHMFDETAFLQEKQNLICKLLLLKCACLASLGRTYEAIFLIFDDRVAFKDPLNVLKAWLLCINTVSGRFSTSDMPRIKPDFSLAPTRECRLNLVKLFNYNAYNLRGLITTADAVHISRNFQRVLKYCNQVIKMIEEREKHTPVQIMSHENEIGCDEYSVNYKTGDYTTKAFESTEQYLSIHKFSSVERFFPVLLCRTRYMLAVSLILAGNFKRAYKHLCKLVKMSKYTSVYIQLRQVEALIYICGSQLECDKEPITNPISWLRYKFRKYFNLSTIIVKSYRQFFTKDDDWPRLADAIRILSQACTSYCYSMCALKKLDYLENLVNERPLLIDHKLADAELQLNYATGGSFNKEYLKELHSQLLIYLGYTFHHVLEFDLSNIMFELAAKQTALRSYEKWLYCNYYRVLNLIQVNQPTMAINMINRIWQSIYFKRRSERQFRQTFIQAQDMLDTMTYTQQCLLNSRLFSNLALSQATFIYIKQLITAMQNREMVVYKITGISNTTVDMLALMPSLPYCFCI